MEASLKRVLVVDDEPDIRAMLKRAIERSLKIPVDTASSGLEALECIRDHHYNVMVTDLAMPEMDGMALFKAVHERHPEIQVIVLTATASVDSSIAAVKSHVFSYITKPVTMDKFVKEVEAALAAQDAARSKASASEAVAVPVTDALTVLAGVESSADNIQKRTEDLAGLAPVNSVLELKAQVIRLREHLRYLRQILEQK